MVFLVGILVGGKAENVGAAKEGAIAVVSAVGGDAVKEVLGDTDWAEIADSCQF